MNRPEQFRIGDVAKLKGLVAPDDNCNGNLVLIKSRPYLHEESNTLIINIELEDKSDSAVSVWNLEKVSRTVYDAYVDHHYLDPNGELAPYDGNLKITWEACCWRPDPNFKRKGNFEI